MSDENQKIMPSVHSDDMDMVETMFQEETPATTTRTKTGKKKDLLSEEASQTKKQSVGNADLIMDIPVEVQVVLGATTMPVANLMKLGRGAVVSLDKQIGDPIDIVVNGRIIARGEVIVMEDDSSRFGVSLTEVIGK